MICKEFNMKKTSLALLLLFSTFLFAGDTFQLMSSQRGDFSPEKLSGRVLNTRTFNQSHESVNFSWPMNPDQKINFDQKPAVVESRAYSMDISPRKLEGGIEIYTTAPGALVRIHAVMEDGETLDSDNSYALQPRNLILVDNAQNMYRGEQALISFIDQDQLDEAGIAPEGTTMFQINPRLGTGVFTLHIDQYRSSAPLRIHVLEKSSAYTLAIQMEQSIVFESSKVTVYGTMANSRNRRVHPQVNELRASLISPSGESYPMRISEQRGRYAATASLPEKLSVEEGLWEVALTADITNARRLRIRRDARTAFALTIPTARFTGQVEVTQPVEDNPVLSMAFEVETSQPARLEVKGYLYGTDEKGELTPMVMVNAADFMEESGWIEVSIPSSTLKETELKAPYKLMGLTLRDQSHMQILSLLKEALILH
jgi:hypothetical protein